MSDAINHYLCGKEILDKLLEKNTVFAVNRDVFNLGTQGPDIFFYYNVLAKPEERINYGSLIHQNKVDDFFYSSITKISSMSDGRDKSILKSYLLGLIAHHALDVATHPFIFYRSGKHLISRPETKALKYNHKKYEVFLDIAFYNNRYSKKACRFPIGNLFKVSSGEKNIIGLFYKDMFQEVFNIKIRDNSVASSIHRTELLTSILNDPTGIKKLSFGFFEILFGSYGKFSNAFYPVSSPDDIKILNLNNEIWHHPSDKTLSFRYSYNQLFDAAVKDGVRKFLFVIPLLTNPAPPKLDSVKSYFKNASYETGLDCNGDNSIRYFDPVI
ncbi:zinc dependent phospholipase C family protein [Alkalibacter saccharofermentans]|uniref:Zinc dependent phospholipase C n=1 Tax=Alkalibacter saccharofermentans DSM 14828 TaxID=1120975 RepID=A0A1M4YBS2_9FIRM|nr:zinc dependent phospholipase C family protein [Alkalibacter saccharofermentans]SHF02962.1 Zinc dependent phospholipase C [Alkalibacter saccharofermentans DSM 14828]